MVRLIYEMTRILIKIIHYFIEKESKKFLPLQPQQSLHPDGRRHYEVTWYSKYSIALRLSEFFVSNFLKHCTDEKFCIHEIVMNQ